MLLVNAYAVIFSVLISSFASAQDSEPGCYSSLGCFGDVVDKISATQSDCCTPSGGLSYNPDGKECFNCYTEESFTSEGNDFAIGFFGNFKPGSETTINRVRFAVDCADPSLSSTVIMQSRVNNGKDNAFQTPFETNLLASLINLDNVEDRDRSVRIFSREGDCPLSIIALNEEIQSSDAFKVLPSIYQPSIGYEYFAVSVTRSRIIVQDDDDYAYLYEDEEEQIADIDGRSALVIVTTEDNTTLLITLTQEVVPKGVIEPGETVSITLEKAMETLYLGSDEDLSGSRIVADKPISFFSGHECGTVPSNITFCDQMNEQIPPTATWGRQFITAPLANRMSGDMFKIVASRNNTDIQITCSVGSPISLSLSRGEIRAIVIDSDRSCYFTSTQPILVVQFSMSSNVDNVFQGDPFMVIVPPVEQYRSQYYIHSFRSFAVTTEEDEIGVYFLNVLAPADTITDDILLNDEVITGSVNEIRCQNSQDICAYSILVEGVTESGVLRHANGSPINAIVYWYDFRVAYGYFAGMTQRPVALPAVSLASAEFTAFENTSLALITLTRAGDLSSAVSVRIKSIELTADDSAVAGEDFVHINESVQIEAGEESVQVFVRLLDDVFPEPTESFQVFLSSSPGVYIQSPALATVVIIDRDPEIPTAPTPTLDKPALDGVSLQDFPTGVISGLAAVIALLLFLLTVIVVVIILKKRLRQKEGDGRVDLSSTLAGIEQPNEAYAIRAMMKKNIAYERTKTGTQRQRMDDSPVLTVTKRGEYENIQPVHQYEEVLPQSQPNTAQYVNVDL